MRLEDRDVLELHQQVEHAVRLETFDVLAYRPQVVRDAEYLHLVSEPAQALGDVVLLLPRQDRVLVVAGEGIGRNQVFVREDQYAQLFHRRYSRLGRERTLW